eukprot:gene21998-biopygen5712
MHTRCGVDGEKESPVGVATAAGRISQSPPPHRVDHRSDRARNSCQACGKICTRVAARHSVRLHSAPIQLVREPGAHDCFIRRCPGEGLSFAERRPSPLQRCTPSAAQRNGSTAPLFSSHFLQGVSK